MAKTKSKPLDHEKFVRAWNAAPDVESVARRFRLTRRQASIQAHSLRRKGVKLIRFGPAGPRVNYSALRLAASGR